MMISTWKVKTILSNNKINSWSENFYSIAYEKKSDTCKHPNQSLTSGALNIRKQIREVIICLDCQTKRILLRKSGKWDKLSICILISENLP